MLLKFPLMLMTALHRMVR